MAIASSPYPPEADAHLWRGYRQIEGQLKIGIGLPRAGRAPLWASRLLNLLVAETAVKLDVVYQFNGFKTHGESVSRLRLTQWFRPRANASQREVLIAVKPACCFVDLAYDPDSGLTDEARRKVAKRNLDVLVWLNQTPLTGNASGAARLGVWSFSFEGASIKLQRSDVEFSSASTFAAYSGAEASETVNNMAGPLLLRGFLDELSRKPAGDLENAARVQCGGGCNNPPEAPSTSNAIAFQREGVWYFFVTAGEPNPETFLFYADARDGEWQYHPANPICSDARRARGAGDLFVSEGKLIRPSRSSCNGGPGILWNEVLLLTKHEYRELPRD
jgi:hypothetical protein